MTFSFVIPTYNNWAGLHQLLWDIYKNCSIPDEVIIMDDDSESLEGLGWWKDQDMLPIQHIRNMDRMGFLLNSNEGLKMATGDVVCLVSTDVRIYQDIVSYPFHNTLMGGRYLDWDTGWNTFNGKIFPYLEGWILTTSRENWKLLGYFDDRYAPNDMEDVDLSAKALERGMFLETYPDGYVSHVGAQSISYGPEREKITIENKRKFRKKWVDK